MDNPSFAQGVGLTSDGNNLPGNGRVFEGTINFTSEARASHRRTV